MKTTISEYKQQAIDFLAKHEITFEAKFLRHGSMHWDKGGETRDIYTLILRRGRQNFSVEFGNSINASGFYYTKGRQKINIDRKYLDLTKNALVSILRKTDWGFLNNGKSDIIHYPEIPTAYSLLTSITKSDPGTFDDFCSEFGYDNDSIRANETWKAVKEEWFNVRDFFSRTELEQLQEIQ